MKTKFLIIIGMIIFAAIYLPIHYYYPFFGLASTTEIFISCEKGFVLKGNYCYPDTNALDPNTVLIYPIASPQQARLAVVPRSLVIFLEKNENVTWINEADSIATIYEKDQRWSIDSIEPKMQKRIKFNQTGFYEYFIDADKKAKGEIAVVSKDTHLLPHQIKLKIASAIVEQDADNYPITGLGIGNAENALYIAIDPSELEKNPDAESFFLEIYKKMIPFDIPIRIEFAKPAIAVEE